MTGRKKNHGPLGVPEPHTENHWHGEL